MPFAVRLGQAIAGRMGPALRATARTKRGSFFLWMAVAMTCTVFAGFWFTYFGPLLRGTYQPVPLIVHLHGWTFFAWYLLLTAQAGLIRSGRLTIHRALGLASIALAVLMSAVGLIVSTVRIDMALGAQGDPFWAFMGVPIFSIWVLFTIFYSAAIYQRKRAAEHKRFMVLASAVALSAATFRIVIQILGFTHPVAVAGTMAPIAFIAAAMIHDYKNTGSVHAVYACGLTATTTLIGGAFLLGTTHGGEVAKQGLGWVGRVLQPLY